MGKSPKSRPAANTKGSPALGDETTTTASAGGSLKVKRTRKSVPRDSPMQRSSIYRGVTRHRWTGRYEAHLWDKNCWNESQNKKGRQVYLGAYDDEEAAAHAYDLAALKYWGQDTILNFPLSTYEQQLKEMEGQSREEYIGSLRRKSSGFSRGVSKYRGVARHHHNGRWEARIGRVFGNKYLYLGTYATQEEAAMAYDMAAIEYRGLNAVTNFDLNRYIKWLRPNTQDGVTGEGLRFPHLHQDTPFLAVDHSKVVGLVAHDMGLDLHTQPQLMGRPESDLPAIAVTATQAVHSQRARASGATSALGLLFQSPKFKEMLEKTAATVPASDDSTSTQRESSSSPPSSDDAFVATRCSFPDDIQTYFECHNDDMNYTEGDDIIFGDLGDFSSTIFDCELDS